MDESLKSNAPWLSTAIEHVREGVVGVDMAGHVVWMNSTAERMTGKKLQQVMGWEIDTVFNSPPAPFADTLSAAIENAIVQGPHPMLFSSENRSTQVECTIAPVSQSGERAGAVIVLMERLPGSDAGTARPPALEERRDRVRRVLVMDDDDVVRTLTVQKLLRLGYESEGASNGEEAVSKFKEAREEGKAFDVVVLDLVIRGGMGGKDTIEMLRSIDPGVKAVLTSGHAVDPVLTNFWEYGFLGVVRKPFVIKELEVVLREAMEDG